MTKGLSLSTAGPSSLQPANSQSRRAETPAEPGPQADRRLVEDCLAGDAAAWQQLYQQHHGTLISAIRDGLKHGRWDANLSEEIAARVWYAVVADGGRLLARYDPRRGCRLKAFLAGIARAKMAQLFRSEGRRRRRETAVVRGPAELGQSPRSTFAEVGEFLETLTPRELEFCTSVLLDAQESSSSFSAANVWQLRSRIRQKLQLYLREP